MKKISIKCWVFISVVLLFFSTLALVQKKKLPVLYLPFESIVEPVNPIKSVGQDWTEVLNQIFERPFFFSRDGVIEPQLAKDWTYDESFKELTIKLKDGVYFHNGKLLDALDVKYSLESLSKSNTQIESQMRFTNIKSIEVLDKLILKIHLIAPSLDFLYFLASSNIRIIPFGILESSKNILDYWVGTGAFRFDRLDGKKVILKKFDKYREKVPLEGIEFIETDNPQELFRQGKLDLIEIARHEIAKYSENEDYVTYSYPIMGSFYIGFNMNLPVFQNRNLRMAIFHAIDRKRIVEGVEIEDFLIPKHIVPIGMPGYESADSGSYNISLAREYLAKVPRHKWPKESDLVVSLPEKPHAMALYAIKIADEGLRKIGLSLRSVEVIEKSGSGKIADFYSYLDRTKNFKIFLRGMIATYPSTDFLLRQAFAKGSPMNFGDVANAKFEAVMRNPPEGFLNITLDSYYKEALSYINEEMPVIPLGNLKSNMVFRKSFPLRVNALSPNFVLYKDSL